jgi:hypothetical protein
MLLGEISSGDAAEEATYKFKLLLLPTVEPTYQWALPDGYKYQYM